MLQKAVLDLGVTSSSSATQIVKISKQAECSDVYRIWLGEDLCRGGDVFVQASIAMLAAPQKKVGIGVTSPLVRNISTIARSAAALMEMAPTRFSLGLGVGGIQDLAKLGLTVAGPIRTMESAVNMLRRIWSGELLTVEDGPFEIRQFRAGYAPGPEIPIYLGVRGPKLLQLAGRIADGVILSGPFPYLRKAIDVVRKENTRRHLAVTPRIVVWLPTLVIRKRIDQELARVVAATVIADTPLQVLEMAEIPCESVERIQRTARKRSYWAASKYVTKQLLTDFTISGKPSDIVELFDSLAGLGVDELVFGPPYGSPPLHSAREVIEAWTRH